MYKPGIAYQLSTDGPVNLRDLGGYQAAGGLTRSGVFFRSDSLHTMNTADLEVVRGRLGITQVIDLRSQGEIDERGIGPVSDPSFTHHHLPLVDQTNTLMDKPNPSLAEHYVVLLDGAQERLVRALEVMAHSEDPVVFHCAAGKDRTGILAALVLSLVGVSDQDIGYDYERTSAVAAVLKKRLIDTRDDVKQSATKELMSSRASTIQSLLDVVRERYDGVDGWATAAGFAAEDAERIRTKLVTTG